MAEPPARERPIIKVEAAAGGWPDPWPNVAELARALPPGGWTLIGGLMTQLHTVHRGLGVTRATNDVDIALHIETIRGLPSATARALEGLGYEFRPAFDLREAHGHRWVRNGTAVDLVTSEVVQDRSRAGSDVVDVVTADHAAPVVRERMRGHDMIAIAGGTQALRRTINASLRIVGDEVTVISVPGPFGALVLKAAAYITDSRDRDRHLFDAAALLACIEDPYGERDGFTGSDGARLRRLATGLTPESGAWLALPDDARRLARDALAVLVPQP